MVHASTREGSEPTPQKLHYRALAHSDRSFLYICLDIVDETCVCDDHAVACIRDMLTLNLYRYIVIMMR